MAAVRDGVSAGASALVSALNTASAATPTLQCTSSIASAAATSGSLHRICVAAVRYPRLYKVLEKSLRLQGLSGTVPAIVIPKFLAPIHRRYCCQDKSQFRRRRDLAQLRAARSVGCLCSGKIRRILSVPASGNLEMCILRYL